MQHQQTIQKQIERKQQNKAKYYKRTSVNFKLKRGLTPIATEAITIR